MHVFVRDLSGTSLSFEANDLPSLRFAVADRTGVPIDEQRLIFGGRQLSPSLSGALGDYGLAQNCTVNLALRLRGGAKKRCACMLDATQRCSSPAAPIVGDCIHCTKPFCSRHRLPEDHKCTNMETCRQAAFDKNKATLTSQQTVSSKIATF